MPGYRFFAAIELPTRIKILLMFQFIVHFELEWYFNFLLTPEQYLFSFFIRNAGLFNHCWSTIYLFNLWGSVANSGHICAELRRLHVPRCIVRFFVGPYTVDYLLDSLQRVMFDHCLWIRYAGGNYIRFCGKIKHSPTLNYLFLPRC